MERVILFDGTRMHITATGCTQEEIYKMYEGLPSEKEVRCSSNLEIGNFECTIEFEDEERMNRFHSKL